LNQAAAMARHKRIQTPGLLRHVMSRGNGRMRIFLDDTDYRKFFFILSDVVDTYDIECWDYCAMPNHYHLALFPRKANLSIAIAYLNSVYAIWWNARHAKVGHVFQGRFKDQIVQREGYLLALCRYIARNPVRAELVDDPAHWRWSSFGATAGLRPTPGFLVTDPILKQFGDRDVAGLRRLYREHVLAQPVEDDLEEQLRSKERILGNRPFKLRVIGENRHEAAIHERATDHAVGSRRLEVQYAASLCDF
jgi:REP element-mobilizing transposase RayT